MKTHFLLLCAFLSASVAPSAIAATCPANLGAVTTPTTDFTVESNGTVTHNTTGLVWKQCVEGLSGANCQTGMAGELLWVGALSAAQTSTFAGFTDWRLPTKRELESIVESSCHTPSINDTVFPNTPPNAAWTGTTADGSPTAAWFVEFANGEVRGAGKSSGGFHVRLVRGGQLFDSLAAVVPAPNAPPETTITTPPISSTSTTATIAFSGTDDVSVVGFECSLDGLPYTACVSSVSFTGLSVGPHTFNVRAIDNLGVADPTPASTTWNVNATVPINEPPAVAVSVPTLSWWLLGLLSAVVCGVPASALRRK